MTTGRKTKASKPTPKDTLQGPTLVLSATQAIKDKAVINVGIMVHNGELTRTEPGWPGTVTGFYLSVLGLHPKQRH